MTLSPVRMTGSLPAPRHNHHRAEQSSAPRFGHHSPEHSALELWHVLAAGGTSLTVMALFAREKVKSAFNAVFHRKSKQETEKESES